MRRRGGFTGPRQGVRGGPPKLPAPNPPCCAACAGTVFPMRLHVLAAALALLTASGQALADRDVLWKIIDGGCVPGAASGQIPPPCKRVEMPAGREYGWAVMKDIRGVLQYLLLPTARI